MIAKKNKTNNKKDIEKIKKEEWINEKDIKKTMQIPWVKKLLDELKYL